MYFIVIIVSDLWWQRGNRVCNNKKQWAFWKTVLYNGNCFFIRIKLFCLFYGSRISSM